MVDWDSDSFMDSKANDELKKMEAVSLVECKVCMQDVHEEGHALWCPVLQQTMEGPK